MQCKCFTKEEKSLLQNALSLLDYSNNKNSRALLLQDKYQEVSARTELINSFDIESEKLQNAQRTISRMPDCNEG